MAGVILGSTGGHLNSNIKLPKIAQGGPKGVPNT